MQAAFPEKKFEPEETPASERSLILEGKEGKLRYIALGRRIFEIWEDKLSLKMRILL